jgi:hypothetical protein
MASIILIISSVLVLHSSMIFTCCNSSHWLVSMGIVCVLCLRITMINDVCCIVELFMDTLVGDDTCTFFIVFQVLVSMWL